MEATPEEPESKAPDPDPAAPEEPESKAPDPDPAAPAANWWRRTAQQITEQNQAQNKRTTEALGRLGEEARQRWTQRHDRPLNRQFDAGLASAARWLQQRSASEPSRSQVADVPGAAILPAEWSGVASSFAALAAAVGEVPAMGEALSLIQALCGVESAESAMMAAIGRDVNLLRTGPFRASEELLSIAVRRGPGHPDYPRLLADCEHQLVTALGLSASIQEGSVVRFRLGMLAMLRGDQHEARYRLGESYENCVQVVDALTRNATDVRVAPGGWTVGRTVFAISGGVYVDAVRKARKVWRAESSLQALTSYVPFVNMVAQTHNALAADVDARPQLALTVDHERGHQLVWTPPD